MLTDRSPYSSLSLGQALSLVHADAAFPPPPVFHGWAKSTKISNPQVQKLAEPCQKSSFEVQINYQASFVQI